MSTLSSSSYFLQGMRAAIPTMLGYLPASIAFGLGGSSLGLSPLELFLISFFVYAGSAQFLILASLQLGTPIVTVVFLVTLLNIRHLLYGPIIERYLPQGLSSRLAKAFYLTDEVFAVCYLRLKHIAAEGKTAWYFGLGIFSWLAWVGGTLIGVIAGESLMLSYPILGETLGFAVTGLFVSVTLLTIQAPMLMAMLVACLSSLLCVSLGYPSLAIILGAIMAALVYRPSATEVKHV